MIRPVSKVVVKFLRVMQKHGYINAFEIIDDARNGKISIERRKTVEQAGNLRLPSPGAYFSIC